MKKNIRNLCGIALAIVALSSVIYSCYLAITYAAQPPLDLHSFRQSQTALTSYWFIQEGFKVAYETPVAGFPWAIPFEFPIYQTIVAYIAKLFGANLNPTGRLVSYLFLLVAIIPVVGIVKRLGLPKATGLYFISILFSMPIYIYWGRSFMIETAAVFFGVLAIKLFLDYLLGKRTVFVFIGFVLSATLCILQKATTGLPILVALSIIYFAYELNLYGLPRSWRSIKSLIVAGTMILIPVVVGSIWVVFTDQIKLDNEFGKQLTSSSLAAWNWGAFSQRISSEVWTSVVWGRILNSNLAGWLGVFLLAAPLLVRVTTKIKYIALGALLLATLPFFFFPSLHQAHDYYQTANALFFAFVVSVSLAVIIAPRLGKSAALFILAMMMLLNYSSLNSGYLNVIKAETNKENSRPYAIGEILKRELSPQMQFVLFGEDWNSSLAYMSQRKAFAVPFWFDNYKSAISDPSRFLESGRMGAIVSCTYQNPSVDQIFNWVESNGAWKVGEVHGCVIVTPEINFTVDSLSVNRCQGYIDRAVVQTRDGKEFVDFAGWLAVDGENIKSPDDILLKISNNKTPPIYLQTLKIPRPDVSRHLNVSLDAEFGLTRLVRNNFKPGLYDVELVYRDGNEFNTCGIRKALEIR